MVKHGIDNFSFEIIHADVPHEKLDEMEITCIKEYNSLRPGGYNLTTGGGHFRHHEETKKLMSQKALANAPCAIDKYRKEESRGLPMYIVCHNKGNSKGFAICGHPLCKYKSFTMCDFQSLEDCKNAAIKFLSDLEIAGVAYEPPVKTDKDLPTGISVCKNGYLVKKRIGKNKYTNKYFCSKLMTPEQKKQAAIDYLKKTDGCSSTTKCQSVSVTEVADA